MRALSARILNIWRVVTRVQRPCLMMWQTARGKGRLTQHSPKPYPCVRRVQRLDDVADRDREARGHLTPKLTTRRQRYAPATSTIEDRDSHNRLLSHKFRFRGINVLREARVLQEATCSQLQNHNYLCSILS